MTHPDVPSLVERLQNWAFNIECDAGGQRTSSSDTLSEAATQLSALETSHAAARANFLTMQNAAAELLKRAEKAEAERDAALEAESEAKDSFWAIYPDWVALKGHGISTEAARTALSSRAERAEEQLKAAREEKQAVITLLYTDEVFVGSHWEQFPDAEKGLWPALCAHASSYGADGEEIPADQIVPLATLVEQFGRDAIQAWVCHLRGIDKPGKGKLSEKGQQALEALRARTALSPVDTKGGT